MNPSISKNSSRIVLGAICLALYGLSLNAFAADYPPKGDPVRGVRAWADNCGRCHNIRDPKELRDDQWITTMHHMRVRAGLTGQQMRDILTFLQQSN